MLLFSVMTLERPSEGTIEVLAIRKAEQDILEAANPNHQEAVELGRNLVKASYDYFIWFAVHHENAHLNEYIGEYKRILDDVDSKSTRGLRDFLTNRAVNMISDPTWFMGQTEDMQKFPDKLMGLAETIGN